MNNMAPVLIVFLATSLVTDCVAQSSVTRFSLQRCRIGMKCSPRFNSIKGVKNIVECARECLYVKRCNSINYQTGQEMCYFCQNTVDLIEDKESVVCDREVFPKVLAGTCSSEPCSWSEKCLPSSTPQCIGYCRLPGLKGAFRQTQCRTVGCGNTFICGDSLVPSKAGIIHNTCQANGKWSKVMTKCVNITSCQEVLDCNAGYGDGEYWVVWSPGSRYAVRKWVKIYCADMQASGSPKEYLSLPVASTTEHAGHKGYFSKIRINVTTLALDLTDFIGSDLTECMPRYGVFTTDGQVCQASNYSMTLDMTNTGLLVQPLPVWEMTSVNVQPATVEYKPNTDSKIVLVYGDTQGNHGTVEPTGGISLVIDEKEKILENAATRPTCI